MHAGELSGVRDHEHRGVVGCVHAGRQPVGEHLIAHRSPPVAAYRCARGSAWSVPVTASRYASRALLAAPLSLSGTATSTVTSKSPVRPLFGWMPLPLTRKVRPEVVPGGIRTVTDSPDIVGTETVAPSAASGNVTGSFRVMLLSRRPKTECGCTCTRTYRSPAGPPFSPGWPRPAKRMRCPSSTPAGTRMDNLRSDSAWPEPPQVAHGSSMSTPRPRQLRHGSANANAPCDVDTCPAPLHTLQVRGDVPGLAPLPWHVGHTPGDESRTGTVTPCTASAKSIDTSDSTSAPRRGPIRRPPKTPPNRSPRPLPPPPPPNKSLRSNGTPPPAAPGRKPPPPGRKPLPKSVRASSYSRLRFSSERTS